MKETNPVNKFRLFLFLMVLSPSAFAWEDCGKQFCYQESVGRCEDVHGLVGFNPSSSLLEFAATRNGNCTHFVEITFWPKDLEERFRQEQRPIQVLKDADLRGARFTGCNINGYRGFGDAKLEGADLNGLFGNHRYAKVTGTIDSFTKFPEDHCQIVNDGTLLCL